MIRAMALVVAASIFGHPPATASAAACVRPNGKLMSRETCRRPERPLDATTLNPVGPTGLVGAPGNAGRFPLAIVDADGDEIGPVLSFEFGTAVVLVSHPTLSSPVPFTVLPSGFGNSGGDYLSVLYTDSSCSGQPYLPAGSADDTYAAHVEGSAAYRIVGGSEQIAVLSSETAEFGLCSVLDLTVRGACCISQTAVNEVVVPAVRISIADLGFTPPFRTVPR